MAMNTITVNKKWTKIGGSGTFQNSSNYKLELYLADEDVAPSETVQGIVVPPWGEFKIPSSGYVYGRCKFCAITLNEDVFKISGGGGGGGSSSDVPIIGGE